MQSTSRVLCHLNITKAEVVQQVSNYVCAQHMHWTMRKTSEVRSLVISWNTKKNMICDVHAARPKKGLDQFIIERARAHNWSGASGHFEQQVQVAVDRSAAVFVSPIGTYPCRYSLHQLDLVLVVNTCSTTRTLQKRFVRLVDTIAQPSEKTARQNFSDSTAKFQR